MKMSKAAKKSPAQLTPEQEIALIKKKLKIFTTAKPVKYWLDTGNPLLNGVFGSRENGIPYGKIFEISGNESNGKTAQMLKIMAMAQKDGAKVGLIDLEDSWDAEWARALGVNPEEVYIFRAEIGIIGDEKEERITTGQEIFAVAQKWMANMSEKYPGGRIVLGIDSVAAILTEEEEAAGIQEQNMRTLVSTSAFLSRLLRRWVAIAANRNAMMIFINQIRMTPGGWGNPETTPGGRALKHYAAIRVRMSRKGKKILKQGKPVGIKGTMSNWKNKAGGGSREGLQAGYKIYFKGKIKIVEAEEIKSEASE
jgi:recombination protein RecA